MNCKKCGHQEDNNGKFCHQCGAVLKNDKKIPIFNLIILIIFLMGLLALVLISTGTIFGKPHLNIGDSTGTNWFGQLKIQFQIYNSGDAPAKNVYADIQIIDKDQITIIKSKSIFVGNLQPGESKTITTTIEGTIPQDSLFRIIPRTQA